MKILLVTPFLPYRTVPHAGGKFVYLLLEHLGRRHEIDLVTRVFHGERRYLEETRRMVANLYPSWEDDSASPQAGSLTGKILSYRRLARLAGATVLGGAYDLVLVEHSETGMFMKTRDWPPAILDCHDIIAKPWYRKWQEAEGAVTRSLRKIACLALSAGERRAAKKFRVLLTRSRQDAEWARKWVAHEDIRILPHPAGADLRVSPGKEIPGRILFLGAMGRQLNVDAAMFFYSKVFPSVRARFPEAQFWVVGGNPPAQLVELGGKDPSLRVTGYVEDIGESYASASIFVAPILIGGGIIVKILDAMAAGVPVVTTAYGNEGIEAVDGEDLFIADSPQDFSARVISLLADEDLRRRIGEGGREFVRSRFDRDIVMAKLETILRETAHRQSKERDR